MSTTTELPDDPFGYRLDLQASLESPTPDAPNPVPVALALAQCTLAGVALPEDLRQRAVRLLPSAVPALRAELAEWAESARTLVARWTATDDPWEADELVRTLVELRTDALGLARVVGESLSPAVREFDVAMKAEEGLLATVVGSNWFANLRQSLAAESLAEAWWLNPTAEPVEDLPPPEYFAVVRGVRQWKSSNPDVIPALGALTRGPLAGMRTFTWMSPDGTLTARLDVLARTTADHRRTAAYPLVFERGTDTPAVELAGTPVRLGTVQKAVNEAAAVSATIADWWADSDGRLFVGDPLTEWQRILPPTG